MIAFSFIAIVAILSAAYSRPDESISFWFCGKNDWCPCSDEDAGVQLDYPQTQPSKYYPPNRGRLQ
jgi:hypothetical protein